MKVSLRLPALASVLFLVCSSFAGAQQSLEQKLDALKEFKRFYPLCKDVSKKVEAIHDLKLSDCKETADELMKLVRAKEPEIREAAKSVLAKYSDPATFQGIVDKLPKAEDQVWRATAVEVLAVARFVPAVPVLTDMLGEKNLSVDLRFELVRAAGIFDAKAAADKVVPFLQDKEYLVRMAAADTLGVLKVKTTGIPVVKLIDDPVWQVQDAAIKAVGKIRVQEAVEPLIELLKKGGRFKMDAADVLFKITSFDYAPGDWPEKWAQLKTIKFKIPSDAEVAKAEAARIEAAKRYKTWKTGATYHGIPTTSTQVLFIIDVSGSMADLVLEREKFKEEGHESFAKLDIVKSELERTLLGLNENVFFNIIAFATKVKKWKPGMTQATSTYRMSAVSFVKSLQPLGSRKEGDITQSGLGAGAVEEGKTNTYEALVAAFDLDPAKDVVITGGGAAPKNKLDTIFLLSDGRPSTGKYVDETDIRREIRKINETRRIVLHCIAIGEFQKDFLQQLAAENGGTFVDLGK